LHNPKRAAVKRAGARTEVRGSNPLSSTRKPTLRLRLRGRAATPEQIQAIVDALDAAAKTIERV
jgi:hypothetical protein